MFNSFRKHAVLQHKELYGEEEHLSDNAISSLTYRYMIAKEFNPKEILEHITSYLKWEKNMSESYNLLMFEHFHSIDVLLFLLSFIPSLVMTTKAVVLSSIKLQICL